MYETLAPFSLTLLLVALKNTAMAADSGFIGTWKLNLQESTFVSRHFKASTLTIDEGSPRPTDRDHPLQREIWWTQEFINDDGQYEAMEWAGNLDGKVMPYKSRLPGTMPILRRDDRTLAFQFFPQVVRRLLKRVCWRATDIA